MKIRKTRIKKTTKANGCVQYTAEYKWGLWWYEFDDSMGPDAHARLSYYDWAKTLLNRTGKFEFSEQEARALIHSYIRLIKYKNACKIENKVVKTEYEGYP